mgnify:FL=1
MLNTDCIQLAEPNDLGSDRKRRCCFFRYSGLNTSGTAILSHKHGLNWFLNLLVTDFIYQKKKEVNPKAKMSWLNPFGTVVDQVMEVDLVGTASFLSVIFKDYERSLPKQNDNYSCGVAVIAGSAILLRDLIHPQERKVEFKSLFSIRNTQVKLIVNCQRIHGHY